MHAANEEIAGNQNLRVRCEVSEQHLNAQMVGQKVMDVQNG